MRVTTDLRPGVAVEFEMVRAVSMAWFTPLHQLTHGGFGYTLVDEGFV